MRRCTTLQHCSGCNPSISRPEQSSNPYNIVVNIIPRSRAKINSLWLHVRCNSLHYCGGCDSMTEGVDRSTEIFKKATQGKEHSGQIYPNCAQKMYCKEMKGSDKSTLKVCLNRIKTLQTLVRTSFSPESKQVQRESVLISYWIKGGSTDQREPTTRL